MPAEAATPAGHKHRVALPLGRQDMVPVVGPVSVACTPFTAIAGAVVTTMLAVAEATGHWGAGSQAFSPLPDPHPPMVRAIAGTSTIHMGAELRARMSHLGKQLSDQQSR